eukprot:gene16481-18709_t
MLRIYSLIFFCLPLLFNIHAQEKYVSHSAGMVVSPDNVKGYQSVAKTPTGISADTNGNIYYSDAGNCLIRMMDGATSKLFTKIGTGICGYNGDDLPGTTTSLAKPKSVWVDSSGSIYIADSNNFRVRRCTALVRMMETVAGNGLSSDSGDSGLATSAGLSSPNDIHGDTSGNLYIACSTSIRFVDVGTGIISTLVSGLLNPQGIYFQESMQILYIAETNANVIKTVTSSGIITTIAGTGVAGKSIDSAYSTSTSLGRYVTAFAEGGSVYHYVGPWISFAQYVGDGSNATLGILNQPNQIWGDTMGTLYVADGGNGLIRKITTSNIISSLGNASGAYSFNRPFGVYGDTSNHLYVSDFAASVLYKIT